MLTLHVAANQRTVVVKRENSLVAAEGTGEGFQFPLSSHQWFNKGWHKVANYCSNV